MHSGAPAGNALPMTPDERWALDTIPDRMARLGYPVEDFSDDELRAQAVRLIGRAQAALEAVALALAEAASASRSGLIDTD